MSKLSNQHGICPSRIPSALAYTKKKRGNFMRTMFKINLNIALKKKKPGEFQIV